MIENTHIDELKTFQQRIMCLNDDSFNSNNVCVVTGAASGIGRVMAIAAAANDLMTLGIDMDIEGGRETQHMARELGGQMIFIETDYGRKDRLQHAVSEAGKMGTIKFLANMATATEDGIDPDGCRSEQAQRRTILSRLSSCLSGLAMAQIKKNGDGAGVIGNLAWHPAGSMLPTSILSHEATLNTDEAGPTPDRKYAEIKKFTINVVHGKGRPLPVERMPDRAGFAEKTTKNVYPHFFDIANMFIFGFSRYAGCLVRGDLFY